MAGVSRLKPARDIMMGESDQSGTEFGRRELHLHPTGADQWIGVVYVDGRKLGETQPTPSMNAAKRSAAERFGNGLKPIIWSQDAGMILSED